MEFTTSENIYMADTIPAGISVEYFFVLQDRITEKLSQTGDSLRKLIAHKELLIKLQPLIESVDRGLYGTQREEMIAVFAKMTLEAEPEIG